jgi:hypothetical protein
MVQVLFLDALLKMNSICYCLEMDPTLFEKTKAKYQQDRLFKVISLIQHFNALMDDMYPPYIREEKIDE